MQHHQQRIRARDHGVGRQRPVPRLDAHARCSVSAAAAGNEGQQQEQALAPKHDVGHQQRRTVLLGSVLTAVAAANVALPAAAPAYQSDYQKEIQRRKKKIPLESFLDGPEGLKYYDVILGDGAEVKPGQRVAVHYDVRFRNVTFITSRQGLGVTGGTPVGFNIGVEQGTAGHVGVQGIDLGVRGMRVGGLRRLIIPPDLAYGNTGVGEIPPGATLTVDLELLSIKTSPLGFRTKLIEG